MKDLKVYSSDLEVLGGAKVFPGTRVPVQTLIDYLQGGSTTDRFLEDFPSVKKQQVLDFLEAVKKDLTDVA